MQSSQETALGSPGKRFALSPLKSIQTLLNCEGVTPASSPLCLSQQSFKDNSHRNYWMLLQPCAQTGQVFLHTAWEILFWSKCSSSLKKNREPWEHRPQFSTRLSFCYCARAIFQLLWTSGALPDSTCKQVWRSDKQLHNLFSSDKAKNIWD